MERGFNYTYELVFDACRRALTHLGMKVEYMNRTRGIISASTQTSIFSWGETIDITIRGTNVGRTNVSVVSNSKAQLFSWGKNEKNEKEILDMINQFLR